MVSLVHKLGLCSDAKFAWYRRRNSESLKLHLVNVTQAVCARCMPVWPCPSVCACVHVCVQVSIFWNILDFIDQILCLT